jgi:hypothetical protein
VAFSPMLSMHWALFSLMNEYLFLLAWAMCCLIPKHKQYLALLSLPFFKRSHTKHPQCDKPSTEANMGEYQTVPEKAEQEAGFAPSTELYGLFACLVKAADSHEEQQVGEKRKCPLESPLMVGIPIRSKSSGDE